MNLVDESSIDDDLVASSMLARKDHAYRDVDAEHLAQAQHLGSHLDIGRSAGPIGPRLVLDGQGAVRLELHDVADAVQPQHVTPYWK